MIETLRGTAYKNLSSTYPGGLYSGQSQESSSTTTALPEVKVGGEYNVTSQLAISLAYLYAFGSNQKWSINNYATPGAISINQQLNLQGPTFNAILLGLRYYI